MSEKTALVLFYDQKDMDRPVSVEGKPVKLFDAVQRGFGSGVKYDIGVASPRHEPWLVQWYMNQRKYDGIMVVGGLSCSLDIPNMLMEELYDNPSINVVAPRDWEDAEIPEMEGGKPKMYEGKPVTHAVRIPPGQIGSKYWKQERRVPILGVPTTDPFTNGEIAFASMVMSSRPSEAACVGVDQGYQAARLMARMLTNDWNDVRITTSQGLKKGIAYDISRLLNKEFKPYEDCNISFGTYPAGDYTAGPISEREVGKIWKPPTNRLHVCTYGDFGELEAISGMTDFVIGVGNLEEKTNSPGGEIDFQKFVEQAAKFNNVVHVRPGVAENAAMFVAQCLSMHPYKRKKEGEVEKEELVWLKSRRFQELRRKKSKANVERFLKSHPDYEKGR